MCYVGGEYSKKDGFGLLTECLKHGYAFPLTIKNKTHIFTVYKMFGAKLIYNEESGIELNKCELTKKTRGGDYSYFIVHSSTVDFTQAKDDMLVPPCSKIGEEECDYGEYEEYEDGYGNTVVEKKKKKKN